MKQQEKTQKTRERILAAALEEFGRKSYDAAAINSICEAGQIPKGLLYHNFKNKDQLYLACVALCYERMTAYMKAHAEDTGDARRALQSFLLTRQRFFAENPHLANIFFNTVLYPPRHLQQDLALLRRDFDAYLTQRYRAILAHLTLREGISTEMALDYFSAIQEMFNSYFQKRAQAEGDYHALIGDHEDKLSGMMDILLYGIARETPDAAGKGTVK